MKVQVRHVHAWSGGTLLSAGRSHRIGIRDPDRLSRQRAQYRSMLLACKRKCHAAAFPIADSEQGERRVGFRWIRYELSRLRQRTLQPGLTGHDTYYICNL